MITRSDLQEYGNSTMADLIIFERTQMDPSLGYQTRTSEDLYEETRYPASIYDLSQDNDSSTKEEVVSAKLKHLVDDMLKFSTLHNEYSCSATAARPRELGENREGPAAENSSRGSHLQKRGIPSENYSRMRSSPACNDDSDTDPKEDYDTFSFSDPNSPSESSMRDKYESPMCHAEAFPFSPSNIDSESEDEIVDTSSVLKRRNYDTSALMYDNDDMTTFTGLVNCDEVLRNHRKKDAAHEPSGTIVCCYRNGPVAPFDLTSKNICTESRSTHNNNNNNNSNKNNNNNNNNNNNHNNHNNNNNNNNNKESNLTSQRATCDDPDNRKGKISGLQRRALDLIFDVTDRPSRGLVLHIAGELCLHHITVKNFFSNGRRRLRRAAARLSDPERTRRENQKRKEKRRLAALAAAASASSGDKNSSKGSADGGNDFHLREPPILSPERRALMEKLAVKVQRSVAQKGLAALSSLDSPSPTSLPHHSQSHNAGLFSPHKGDHPVMQLHSNSLGLTETAASFSMQPTDDSSYHSPTRRFKSIFSYPESEPMSVYDSSSSEQNSIHAFEQETEPNYRSIGHNGPYSPTSWQTLLHA